MRQTVADYIILIVNFCNLCHVSTRGSLMLTGFCVSCCSRCLSDSNVTKRAYACRRDDLLQESRDWITPETLDARIEHALDNPVELYDLLAQQDWNYKDGGKNSP